MWNHKTIRNIAVDWYLWLIVSKLIFLFLPFKFHLNWFPFCDIACTGRMDKIIIPGVCVETSAVHTWNMHVLTACSSLPLKFIWRMCLWSHFASHISFLVVHIAPVCDLGNETSKLFLGKFCWTYVFLDFPKQSPYMVATVVVKLSPFVQFYWLIQVVNFEYYQRLGLE